MSVRRWRNMDWLDRFALTVTAAVVLLLVAIVVLLRCNGDPHP